MKVVEIFLIVFAIMTIIANLQTYYEIYKNILSIIPKIVIITIILYLASYSKDYGLENNIMFIVGTIFFAMIVLIQLNIANAMGYLDKYKYSRLREFYLDVLGIISASISLLIYYYLMLP